MTTLEPTPSEVKEQKLYADWGLTDEEYALIEDILGRMPNYTEAGLYSVMWSEHCSYKHSKVFLRNFPTDGPQVLQGPGEGAGIVDIGDNQAIAFKVESHNHPSAVEPYEGAATGVGGIIRDVFSMGAQPIASMNSLRFGELDDDRTKFLVREVARGIGGYGNALGVPTVGGEITFDPCYRGNPLVNAMVVGLMDHKDIQKGRAAGVGNSVMYAGATTGRDGIHGATFASASFEDEDEDEDAVAVAGAGMSAETGANAGAGAAPTPAATDALANTGADAGEPEEAERSAVQAGDPFTERVLMDACLDLIRNHSDIVVGIQDMGAAGLVSSSSEMASKAGFGLELNLDLVPTREDGMTPYEMMLSESQERMLICVKRGEEERVRELFEDYGINAVTIGEVTDDKQYRLYFQGDLVCDIPVDSLADAPEANPPRKMPARLENPGEPWVPSVTNPGHVLLDLLAAPTVASKRALFETYDSQARCDTVVLPGSDAGVVRVRGTNKALAITTDCNGRYLYLNPRVGAQIAVAEAARNAVAAGAKPLAITDGLNFGSPVNPEAYWELGAATEGIAEACAALEVPVISGNVSLYNEFDGESIYPTPVIGLVGLVSDLEHVTTQYFKDPSDLIYVVGQTGADFDGSELQKLQAGRVFGPLMDFDLKTEAAVQDFVLAAIRAGLVKSAHDVSEGGLAVAIAESTFAPDRTDLGVDVALDMPSANLFSETQSRFVVSISRANKAAFEKLAAESRVVSALAGEVTDRGKLSIETADGAITVPTSEARRSWEDSIPSLLK